MHMNFTVYAIKDMYSQKREIVLWTLAAVGRIDCAYIKRLLHKAEFASKP
jgi:hypothetical protein